MLIITRRIGEKLMIGDDVSIIVLDVKGNQVRIGIDAPREVAVHREEIYHRIQQENSQNAAKDSGGDGDGDKVNDKDADTDDQADESDSIGNR